MEARDKNVLISNRQVASKMLRGPTLAREKKSQTLTLDPDRNEIVLRGTFPKMHETETRTG